MWTKGGRGDDRSRFSDESTGHLVIEYLLAVVWVPEKNKVWNQKRKRHIFLGPLKKYSSLHTFLRTLGADQPSEAWRGELDERRGWIIKPFQILLSKNVRRFLSGMQDNSILNAWFWCGKGACTTALPGRPKALVTLEKIQNPGSPYFWVFA